MIRLLLATSLLAGSSAWAQSVRTITVATHYTAEQVRPLLTCFREYEASRPGLHIVHRQSAIADYLQTVMTGRISGRSPDIYNVYTLWAAQLIEAQILATPPAAVVADVERGFAPSTASATRVGGRLWGFPGEISTYMLVYNKKLLTEAGAPGPPHTWDELAATAAKITRRNAQGTITRAGYAFGPTVANGVHPFEAMLYSRGLTLFTADLLGTNLNTPEAAEILAAQSRLFASGVTSDAVQVQDFPSGAVGMAIMANWNKKTLRQGFGAAFHDTVGVSPIPAGPDWRTVQYGFFFGVDAKTALRDEAWALLRWLNAPHGGQGRSCMGDMLVSMGALTGNLADIAASGDELGDDFTRPYVEAVSTGRAMSDPNLPHAAEILETLRDAIGRAWGGREPATEALRVADQRISGILAENR